MERIHAIAKWICMFSVFDTQQIKFSNTDLKRLKHLKHLTFNWLDQGLLPNNTCFTFVSFIEAILQSITQQKIKHGQSSETTSLQRQTYFQWKRRVLSQVTFRSEPSELDKAFAV